ncbi:glycerol-3-phosphate acyltransferase PlsX [Thermosulfidibacter takaii ABI70S6]|uniref:Phosphate acyltransferase n=1 Tax=Thermosulfidibacter takaii (strain DSM 17441 / JCM 13301 / NBRC 103674 / ABI70S6) TaxID=1298851 RepID=A0A0S3QUV8_THET7|nr:phosphate acyltransferase PlsX [Thermosulfidibacter takaii]BAT72118.1 glycerol-3-phosphate acyltransferase PlsX [Thermosulfidibacter takaii ABI70S6]
MRIALDAMGGDYAPSETVKGAIQALKLVTHKIILVGDREILEQELDRFGAKGEPRLLIKHAPEVIKMDDQPLVALRKKRRSSIRMGLELVKSGAAQVFVSAGNTGAVMLGAKMILGSLKGISRPAIAVTLPSKKDPFVLIDAGANVDSKPENLVEFAIMGHIYARHILGRENPRIGLLSIGEEDLKGNGLTKNAFMLLKAVPQINFIGNVEGKEFYEGKADVVVCDGFVGNLALKISESASSFISHLLGDVFRASIFTKLAYLLLRKRLKGLREKVDYRAFGGAPLLGVRGTCIICHGSSNAEAIANAIKVAVEMAEKHVNERIEANIEAVHEAIGVGKSLWKQLRGKLTQFKDFIEEESGGEE